MTKTVLIALFTVWPEKTFNLPRTRLPSFTERENINFSRLYHLKGHLPVYFAEYYGLWWRKCRKMSLTYISRWSSSNNVTLLLFRPPFLNQQLLGHPFTPPPPPSGPRACDTRYRLSLDKPSIIFIHRVRYSARWNVNNWPQPSINKLCQCFPLWKDKASRSTSSQDILPRQKIAHGSKRWFSVWRQCCQNDANVAHSNLT